MPNYEYKCKKCKKTFEHSQRITEKPLKACVYCKGKVERLISAGAGFIFKGSGFYETDYKRRNVGSSSQKSEKPKEKKDAKD